ncbi:MAG: DUF455 domain-containing protein, partial [Polynucleobacter victoriensis]
MNSELRSQALSLLSIKEPHAKCMAVAHLREEYLAGNIKLNEDATLSDKDVDIPGRPDAPVLVNPGLVKRRSMVT